MKTTSNAGLITSTSRFFSRISVERRDYLSDPLEVLAKRVVIYQLRTVGLLTKLNVQSTIRTWSFALAALLVVSACQSESDNTPAPQADSVQISNQTYPIQSIGNQVWTTINYSGPGGLAYGAGKEKTEYGRYYTFDEVKAIELPNGWRIPTMQDYIILAQSQGIVFENNRATRQEAIQKLLSTTNWRTKGGNNASGFNAYPTGYSFQNAPPQDGDLAEFWLTDGKTVSIQEVVGSLHNLSFYDNSNDPTNRFTVRFVKSL